MGDASRRVFLDANVLFSAALGGASFVELWAALAARGLVPCTSPQCVDEARRNVTRKRPLNLPQLDATLAKVELTPAPTTPATWAGLPEDDAWVLAAAVECGAVALLTGNTRDFGALMARADLPLAVRTVRAWLDAPP